MEMELAPFLSLLFFLKAFPRSAKRGDVALGLSLGLLPHLELFSLQNNES